MTADFIEGNINEMGVLQEEDIIINSVGAFFAAGTDTVSSTLSTVLRLDLRIGLSSVHLPSADIHTRNGTLPGGPTKGSGGN